MNEILEMKNKVNKLMEVKDYEQALPIYQNIYIKEKSCWNAYYLAKCLRKNQMYEEAINFIEKIKKEYPKFKAINNEELWLEYFILIIQTKNENYIEKIEKFLKKVNQYDKYSGRIFCLTVFRIVNYCIVNEQFNIAFNWLKKLDFSILSKTNNNFKDKIYPSDYKNYFSKLTEILIRTGKYKEYIENCLTSLGFEGEKHKCFYNIIINEISFKSFNSSIEELFISRFLLSNLLRNFKEELNLKINKLYRNHSIYNSQKPILMSEISDFLFCPVSYAINVCFKLPSDFSWENDEWYGKKVKLLKRYSNYRAYKDLSKVFDDVNISIDDKLKKDFADLFSSKLIYYSVDNSNSKYFSNKDDTIRGKPDYIFENRNNEKFVVIEKFTKSPRNMDLYPNDKIKILTCLYEFEELNLKYGYMIYWYWNYIKDFNDEGKKISKIKIISYKIFKLKNLLIVNYFTIIH